MKFGFKSFVRIILVYVLGGIVLYFVAKSSLLLSLAIPALFLVINAMVFKIIEIGADNIAIKSPVNPFVRSVRFNFSDINYIRVFKHEPGFMTTIGIHLKDDEEPVRKIVLLTESEIVVLKDKVRAANVRIKD